FDFEAVPMISKAQVMALAAGDRWLDEGANLILFGPPGVGKSHLAAAIGLALVEGGYRAQQSRQGGRAIGYSEFSCMMCALVYSDNLDEKGATIWMRSLVSRQTHHDGRFARPQACCLAICRAATPLRWF